MSRRSIRLPGHDYRSCGAYFVTICSYGRQCDFGEGENAILERIWKHIGKYSRGARGDTFVAMPNHVHGIVWLTRDPVGAQHVGNRGAIPRPGHVPDDHYQSGIARAAPLRSNPRDRLVVPPGSLGAIVRAYKSATAKRINELRGTQRVPVWQRGYHERVIRNERELDRVRQYIIDNPAKWDEDRNNPANF